jgi:linoleoyl-CoA desaturase
LEILPIFKELSQKHGLTYMEMPYRKSLASHFRFLKVMGQHQQFKPIPFER